MTDFKAVAAELACEPWAMEPQRLEALLSRLSEPAPEGPRANHDRRSTSKSRMTVENGVARIPISGVLVRSMPRAFDDWGIEATTYQQIQDDLAGALANEEVDEICLAVSSPGGQVAGVKETADAIFTAKKEKRVHAEISDIGASAAYWLASQAAAITASPNALVGSIGVYSAYMDLSRLAENIGIKVHLIASAPLKGMGVPGTRITEPQLAAMQEVIDGMAAGFKADVARGRGMDDEDLRAVATGRVWTAEQGAQNGLVDGITKPGMKKSPAGGPSAAIETAPEGEEETVNDPKNAAEQEKIRSEAVAQTRDAEKARVQSIREAFPKDPAFAMEQVAAGATLEQAKAAYADVLQARLDESEKARKAAEDRPAPRPASPGAPPVPAGGAPEAGEKDFMELARAYSAEKKCSMSEAMAAIASAQPAVHRAFIEKTAGPARERRKALGIGG